MVYHAGETVQAHRCDWVNLLIYSVYIWWLFTETEFMISLNDFERGCITNTVVVIVIRPLFHFCNSFILGWKYIRIYDIIILR